MSVELICLVADKNIEAVLDGLLGRRAPALRIRPVNYRLYVHPQRDPGCLKTGADFLVSLLDAAKDARGLLVFDQSFDGNPHATAQETERAVRESLRGKGVSERAEVVVIDPELEAWVFSSSPHVPEVLAWEGNASLSEWLSAKDLWPRGSPKPPDPKAALETVLFERRLARSSALYRKLAEKVSLDGCQDQAFRRLRRVLYRWFPYRDGGAS